MVVSRKVSWIIGLFLALTFLGGYSVLIEPYWIEVNQFKIQGSVSTSIKIAHLTDLHTAGLDRREKQIITILQQENPDLIVITGDTIQDQDSYSGVVAFLEKLSAPLGIWITRGNWENWFPAKQKEQRILASSQWRFLVNESSHIKDNLWIVGLDDSSSGTPNPEAAFRAVPQGAFVLALIHAPTGFVPITDRCHLCLAGHTHGGQIRLPFIGPIFLPSGSKPFVSGWYESRKCKLYVNRGVGTSILPMRFWSRPEIAFITLLPK